MKVTNYLIQPHMVRLAVKGTDILRPFARIERERGLQDIYETLSTPEHRVTMIEAVYSPHLEQQDCFYVDEEARLSREDEDHAWWCLKGHPSPISGTGLVCGTDAEGGDKEPDAVDLDWLKQNVLLGWRDFQLDFSQDTPHLTQSPGVHVLDRWAHEGRINDQRYMESMGLSTYGRFYQKEED